MTILLKSIELIEPCLNHNLNTTFFLYIKQWNNKQLVKQYFLGFSLIKQFTSVYVLIILTIKQWINLNIQYYLWTTCSILYICWLLMLMLISWINTLSIIIAIHIHGQGRRFVELLLNQICASLYIFLFILILILLL